VKLRAVSGRVIFLAPPPGRKGTENHICPDLFPFWGGGVMKIWVYTGDMDLFQFNTFISVCLFLL